MALKKTLKKLYYRFFRKHPYTYLGNVIMPFLSKEAKDRYYEDFFLNRHKGIRKILRDSVRYAIDDKYYSMDELKRREMNKKVFWGRYGKAYHNLKKDQFKDSEAFDKIFLKTRGPLVDNLAAILKREGGYGRVCEIGAGNGILLDYLSRKLTGVGKFIGLDLSEETVNRCRLDYKDNTKLEFHNLEVLEYVDRYYDEPTVFVAYDTLRYFTAQELEDTLRRIKSKNQKIMFAIGESVFKMDFDKDFESKPLVFIAYSHNYPHVFKKAGFDVEFLEIRPAVDNIESFDFVYLIARG